jgi:hypothetical protein
LHLFRAELEHEPRLQTVMDTKAFRRWLYPPPGRFAESNGGSALNH